MFSGLSSKTWVNPIYHYLNIKKKKHHFEIFLKSNHAFLLIVRVMFMSQLGHVKTIFTQVNFIFRLSKELGWEVLMLTY